MQVQVNSGHIKGSVGQHDWISESVSEQLYRFEGFLTRLDIHISDENGAKAGAKDKRCQIEARPKGYQPVSVTHHAPSLDLAVDGAAVKLCTALDRIRGRLDVRAASTAQIDDPRNGEDSPDFTDSLLQDEFLDRQRELDNR